MEKYRLKQDLVTIENDVWYDVIIYRERKKWYEIFYVQQSIYHLTGNRIRILRELEKLKSAYSISDKNMPKLYLELKNG